MSINREEITYDNPRIEMDRHAAGRTSRWFVTAYHESETCEHTTDGWCEYGIVMTPKEPTDSWYIPEDLLEEAKKELREHAGVTV